MQAASGGRLQIQLHSNASLLRMPEIKRGVQTGQVQIGEILLSAYGNEDPFFEVDSVPQLVTSTAMARKLAELQKPYVEARLQRQGISLLYWVPWPPSGLYTNTPLESVETLRGTKMRTFNALTNRFATLCGATPTLVQQAEVPQAFATGVVNAMVTSAATGVDVQAWDFCRVLHADRLHPHEERHLRADPRAAGPAGRRAGRDPHRRRGGRGARLGGLGHRDGEPADHPAAARHDHRHPDAGADAGPDADRRHPGARNGSPRPATRASA